MKKIKDLWWFLRAKLFGKTVILTCTVSHSRMLIGLQYKDKVYITKKQYDIVYVSDLSHFRKGMWIE